MAKGILSNSELVETLIVDLNNVLKEAVNGQYIQACVIVSHMSQKLLNLRKGINADIDSKNQIIESLKEELRNAGCTVEDVTPEELFADQNGKAVPDNGCD